ncbi:ABC transporter substrate-binding protein [Paenibacillus bovis]|uniref:ABC transporter substrate-binding protein n=1 Tax=Paenibacillus bovis TaxID=1616788 RepID=A0A172ZHA1_9BACL|nr:ABC transporter substrate-binding protein [Paenibacillus bovis]ANF96909.1 ABC transporter substrate-binding protein [Paenibacillus bovis]
MKFKPFWLRKWSLLGMSLFLFLAACSGGQSSQGSEPAAAAGSEASSGPVKVVWWHSMSGELGKTVDSLVKQFNDSQKDVQVEAVYQGEYDEGLNKFKAAMGSGSGPTMMQTYEVGSRFMIDSQAVTPMQQFIDADKFDVSQLEENILSYYTFDNKLYSMPFNTSNPILYYNKDAFKAAGLDPENPPTTYADVEKAAKALTKDGQSGGSFPIYGWLMEQLLANQDVELLNNSNGRSGLATESMLNSDAAVNTLTWWKKMVDDGVMLNLGRKTDDTKKAFAAGQIAMTMDSTASLRGIVSSAEGKFEVGTAPIPKPSADYKGKGGVIVGGASLWIMNDKPEAEQQAAWKFIKFLTEPSTQAYWNVNTGYFPITKKAYDEDLIKENMKKYPQFETAVNQLHNTKIDPATQGAVMGIFPEARQLTETAMEEAINGSKSPKQALDDAAAQITQKLQDYNDSIAQ